MATKGSANASTTKNSSSGTLADAALQKNETHNERQDAINHVAQEQAPMKKLHQETMLSEADVRSPEKPATS